MSEKKKKKKKESSETKEEAASASLLGAEEPNVKKSKKSRGIAGQDAANGQTTGSSQDHLFKQVRARIPIKLLPASISNISEAVSQELSQMLLRLDPILGGVPLTISKVKLPQVSVPIFEDQPQLHLDVVCDILLFSPQVGQVLHGIVNNVAEDSVGMLILDTFNATIPRAELEPEYWFDSASTQWQRQGEAAEGLPAKITVGQALVVRCLSLKTSDSVIQVIGGLREEGAKVAGEHGVRNKKSKRGKT